MIKNEIKVFSNGKLGVKVRTMVNPDGSISINAEDAAMGYGWTREKNGRIYVMWDRFNDFCKESGFPHKCGKGDYIPEALFYRLGMKANNEAADDFQNWLAFDVLPDIRKTGTYTIGQQIPLKEQIEAIGAAADILRVNEAGKILMIGTHFKSYNLPTDFLPTYVSNGNRQYKSATELLKEHGIGISAAKFNQRLQTLGYLEERERPSSSGRPKKFKALTDKSLQYGENLINPKNQKEVQPCYYTDTFIELCRLLELAA